MHGKFDPNAAATADSGIFGLPHTPEEAALVLLPVPWEATTSYGAGTALGTAAILAASRQLDLFDLETGNAFEAGIAMLPEPEEIRVWNGEARPLARQIIASGGRTAGDERLERARKRVNELSARVNEVVRLATQRWLEAGKLVGVVGGEHSVPFGAIQACASRSGELGILHLDAHSDTRRAFEGFEHSHASIMENVLRQVPAVTRLVQVGVRDFCEEEYQRISSQGERVSAFFDSGLFDAKCSGTPWSELVERILLPLPREVWLSFDIDGLEPSLCPHTGTPVPGGLSFHEAVTLVRGVVRSGRRIAGFDLCEVSPGAEGDEWDANVGARLLYKMSVWTLFGGPVKP